VPQSPAHFSVKLKRDTDREGVELEWQSVRAARNYHVVVARSSLFTDLVGEWTDHPQTFLQLRDLPVGKYFWRVAAVDRDGVEGGFSPANMFRVSDVMPEGDPPRLRILRIEALGDGLFNIEGSTQAGIHVSLDDGYKIYSIRPAPDGSFRQMIQLGSEGTHTVTITARASNGLETTRRVPVKVVF
jgi:hypothetical protein